MAQPRSVVDLLRDLVAIPSVNPSGDPGTPHVNEQGMADYLARFLADCGAEVEFQKVAPQRPNILGTWKPPGRAKGRHVLFAPHTDTVSVLGMTIPPFDPVVKNGKIYGRGATDTKGPMAAALWALREWSRSPARKTTKTRLSFVGLMGEEAGNEGAIALVKSGFKADFVVVGEPTGLEIIYSHKGALWLNLVAKGKACHSSTPERGVNAIYPMARAVAALEKKVLPKLARQVHPQLGAPTMSVGTIRGGSKINIVPDSCVVECDVRTVPQFDSAEIFPLVQSVLAEAAPEVEVTVQRSSPALFTDPALDWVQRLGHVARRKNVAPWFCDAAIFARSGIPAVAFGPGSIKQAHVKDEYMAVRDLEEGTAAYRKFLESLSA